MYIVTAMATDTATAVTLLDIPDKWMRDDRSKDTLCDTLTRMLADARSAVDGLRVRQRVLGLGATDRPARR